VGNQSGLTYNGPADSGPGKGVAGQCSGDADPASDHLVVVGWLVAGGRAGSDDGVVP
jgi:hypothetical protein